MSNADESFEDFVAANEIEVGSGVKDTPRPDSETEQEDSGNEEDSDESPETEQEDQEEQKPKKSSKDYQIERLKREKAEMARRLREIERTGVATQLLERLENLEKGLTAPRNSDNFVFDKPEPDPKDSSKYPLGPLDDRYIEDKLEWLAEKKAAERAESVLRRQQEIEQQAAQQQQMQQLLQKVDDISARGADLFEDFQETVVETGMRGDWDLDQPTFEAACEAENGARILYDLARNPKEASRVARLSPYQQLKYVQEKDAEISRSRNARHVPRAGEPPKNTPRGVTSRMRYNLATDDLDEFEKAWEAEARKSRR